MKKMIETAIKLRVWLVLAIATLSFTSCLKDDNNNYSVQAAGIALINAAPGSKALDFISESDVNYLPKVFAYDSVLTYRSAYPGFRVFGVTLHNSNQLLGSQQFYIEPAVAYSLFITDTIGKIKLVLLKDSLSSQDTAKATIRFANMSADAPKLSVELIASSTTTIKDITYSTSSDFESVAPNDNYTFRLINSETKKVLSTKTKVDLKKGHIYTIWAKGVFESATPATKLGLGMMEN